jgi:hypothetical protein
MYTFEVADEDATVLNDDLHSVIQMNHELVVFSDSLKMGGLMEYIRIVNSP